MKRLITALTLAALVAGPALAEAKCKHAKPGRTYIGHLGNDTYGRQGWRCQITFNKPFMFRGSPTMTFRPPSSCYGPNGKYMQLDGSIALKGCRVIYKPLNSTWGAINDYWLGRFKGRRFIVRTKHMGLKGKLKRR